MTATFTEAWFSDHSQHALAELARSVTVDGDFVEVGCWEGRSTIALAKAVAPKTLHAVDTWQGSPGEISADLAKQRDVYATFTRNIDAATTGNVVIHRMGWRDYFADRRRPLAFLHIDATHSYDEVRDNIETALELLVPGGLLCGDDNHHPPVRDAVWDTLGNAWLAASLWYWRKE